MATGAFATAAARALEFNPVMYMEEFLTEKAAQDCSAVYVRMTRNGLSHFADFLRLEGLTDPADITRLHLVRFQAHANDKVKGGTWKKSTSIQYLKSARSWINWLEDVDHIDSNPWSNIRVGKVDKKPNPLSDNDMDALWRAHNRGMDSVGHEDPFTYHRREMVLTLLYSWGLRIHELEALTIANMDMRLDFVVCINKGGGSKTLPFTPEIKRTYQRWDRVRQQHAAPGQDSLLITQNGTMLPKEMIRTIVSNLGKAAGVTVNPHRLRDTCGTNMLDDDVPVERVQAILGHSNLAQTLAYARVNDKAVYSSVERSMDPRLRMFQNTRDLR